ncbi:Hypothetical protein SMAX5B_007728 [Scophthalmus maximus]|uniref:Uncharacterized protein n=1 Tax=Scophthalmus maximus TaxID=52904 RepID=A0A2U9B249_SCOMX|nr:Hypothetical protein SMAX5B_007728 [Scophthalmus maximus]
MGEPQHLLSLSNACWGSFVSRIHVRKEPKRLNDDRRGSKGTLNCRATQRKTPF